MANSLLDSSSTSTTTEPGYITDYKSNLAKQATDAAGNAQYVGANSLQTDAFGNVKAAGESGNPAFSNAGNTLNTAVNNASPLSSAQPYLSEATGSLGNDASALMSPYTANVVTAIGDAGQRNIQQNLAPAAVAGAVGSGQFGSKRGAEVLGQTISNADRDILNAQSQALGTGYNSALQAALGQHNAANTAASTASSAANAGTTNLINAANANTTLGETTAKTGLSAVDAQLKAGEQQRVLDQNKELFPLSTAKSAADVLRGYSSPTTVTNTASMSPLSAAAGIGAGTIGLFTPGANGTTPYDNIQNAYNKITGASATLPPGVTGDNSNGTTTTPNTPNTGSPEITGGDQYGNTGSGSPPITGGDQFSGNGGLPSNNDNTGGATGGANDDPSLHPGQYWDDGLQQWTDYT